jgi:nucleoside-diphosphate-sugar epimerase
MKILVTGATGFIGACLTRRLLQLGHDIHAFVRQESNRWRIADIEKYIVLHSVDLRDAHAVGQSVSAIKPDKIIHLATYGGFAFQKDVSSIYGANLLGTVNLIHACAKTGFDCFINTGSSSEYGIKSQAMQESDLLEPLGDYGVSKAAATLFCRSEAVQKNLPIVNLRIFSPYGPLDAPHRLIPYVVSSVLNGHNPDLSNPDHVRDYIFIEDVINAYLAVMNATVMPGEIYNIGSGKQLSIGEVVDRILCNLDSNIAPTWSVECPKRHEPVTWVADIRKTKTHFNWEPNISIDDGLRQTIVWVRNNLTLYTNLLST